MEDVMVQVLERSTERLIARQRTMYGSEPHFLEKWRTAWGFQEDDLAGGYSKIWLELQALSWNRPELRARVQRVNDEWRSVLTEAYAPVLRAYRIDDAFPVDAVVALVMTMAQGYALERLSGIEVGHETLLRWIEDWLASLERTRAAG